MLYQLLPQRTPPHVLVKRVDAKGAVGEDNYAFPVDGDVLCPCRLGGLEVKHVPNVLEDDGREEKRSSEPDGVVYPAADCVFLALLATSPSTDDPLAAAKVH